MQYVHSLFNANNDVIRDIPICVTIHFKIYCLSCSLINLGEDTRALMFAMLLFYSHEFKTGSAQYTSLLPISSESGNQIVQAIDVEAATSKFQQ